MNKDKPYIIDGQRVSIEEYKKTKYEDLRIRVPKGKKEQISSHAEKYGKSLNSLVNEAIDEKMQRDNDTNPLKE